MTIEKLPSGSYRIRRKFEGKRYTVIVQHKPTEAEAEKLMLAKISTERAENRQKAMHSQTFQKAAETVLEDKANVLSPATIRGYSNVLEGLPDAFKNLPIDKITQQDIQRVINQLSAKLSGKTVANYHGFISSVLRYFRPEFVLSTKLPPKKKKEPYIPNTDEAKALIEASKGTQFELPILLGCLGMRRGEICALTMNDIDGNKITIDKDMVQDKDDKWVIKMTPKTDESNRVITVPDYVIELINERGLFKNYPGYITIWMLKTERQLGMKNTFSLHDLRHYFASESHENHMTDAQIMRFGGWKTDYVMKRVYRHALEDKGDEVAKAALKGLVVI